MDDLADPGPTEVWEDDTLPGAVWMRGRSVTYAVDPVDELIIGAPVGPSGYHLHRHGHTDVVRPGDLVALDPEHPHRGTPTGAGAWDGRLLVLPTALLWSELDDVPLIVRQGIDRPVVRSTELHARFVHLHRASRQGASRLARQSALLALLDDLTTELGGPPRRSGDPVVAAAVEILRDTFPLGVDLDELAAATGSTRFALFRRFRRELGVTPHAFLVSLRVAHARRLLGVGTPISDAAVATGFSDQSHLHRNFRDRLGLTPGRYRALASTRR